MKVKGDSKMEIKYAHEMADKAKTARKNKRAKDNAVARVYIEEHLMKDIEAAADKGENTLYRCLVAIEDEAVKEAVKGVMRNYGYDATYTNGILSLSW